MDLLHLALVLMLWLVERMKKLVPQYQQGCFTGWFCVHTHINTFFISVNPFLIYIPKPSYRDLKIHEPP